MKLVRFKILLRRFKNLYYNLSFLKMFMIAYSKQIIRISLRGFFQKITPYKLESIINVSKSKQIIKNNYRHYFNQDNYLVNRQKHKIITSTQVGYQDKNINKFNNNLYFIENLNVTLHKGRSYWYKENSLLIEPFVRHYDEETQRLKYDDYTITKLSRYTGLIFQPNTIQEIDEAIIIMSSGYKNHSHLFKDLALIYHTEVNGINCKNIFMDMEYLPAIHDEIFRPFMKKYNFYFAKSKLQTLIKAGIFIESTDSNDFTNNPEKLEFLISAYKKPYNISIMNRNVYLSRERTSFRRIINNEELLNLLEEFNFETIFLEDYDLSNQIRIINSAKIIIGSVGTGLGKILFCNRNANVISICNYNWAYNSWMKDICDTIGLKYYMYIDHEIRSFDDVLVDVQEIKNIINSIIK